MQFLPCYCTGGWFRWLLIDPNVCELMKNTLPPSETAQGPSQHRQWVAELDSSTWRGVFSALGSVKVKLNAIIELDRN